MLTNHEVYAKTNDFIACKIFLQNKKLQNFKK